MTTNKGGNPNPKSKRSIKNKRQNVNRNRGNTTSTTTNNNKRNRKKKNNNEFDDETCDEKDNKGFSLSSVFSSLHNIQQQINMKQRSADEASLSVAKLKQVNGLQWMMSHFEIVVTKPLSLPPLKSNITGKCVVYLWFEHNFGKICTMIIFVSLLTTLVVINIIRGIWDSRKKVAWVLNQTAK